MKVRHTRGHLELDATTVTVTRAPTARQPQQLLRVPLPEIRRVERRRGFLASADVRLRTAGHDPHHLAHPDTDPLVVHLRPLTRSAARRQAAFLAELTAQVATHTTARPVLVDVPALTDTARPADAARPTGSTAAARAGSQWAYNAPPNWDVPAGWTPPVGWRPNPKWGPAPPGWNFWVPAHEQPPLMPDRDASRPDRPGNG